MPCGSNDPGRSSPPTASPRIFGPHTGSACWLLGVAFQGRSQHGWEGNLEIPRDRKGPVPEAHRPPYLILDIEFQEALLWLSPAFLGNRLVQRTLSHSEKTDGTTKLCSGWRV